jgi:erythronate-4-phosphate dehydrogenase
VIRIVADDKIPFLRGILDKVARIEYLPGDAIKQRDLLSADALITRTRTRCNRDLLEGTAVRFIASATIGFDHIDTSYCRQRGIRWSNAPGCNSSSVRQYMVSALLYLASEHGVDLSGMTLGVVGVGNVGSKVASAAEGLGMNVLLNDPPRMRREGAAGFVELDELLSRSDIVSLHVPLERSGADPTWHLVDEAFLQKVKDGVILFNTSRGEVADEKTLLQGMRQGKLSKVVLDVFEHEPDIHHELLEEVTLATPHIAGYSLDGKANGTTAAVRSVSRFFDLGQDHWKPENIPSPVPAEILADASQDDPAGLLWEIYRQSYDVTADDQRLRENPSAFEHLRGTYPPRREPPAFAVRLFQGYPEIRAVLEGLGFSVLSDYCA